MVDSIPTSEIPYDVNIVDFKILSHIGLSQIQYVDSITMDDTNTVTPKEIDDPFKYLKTLKLTNVIRIIIGQLDINSLRNKFDSLCSMVTGNPDILVITETKLDESFPSSQFIVALCLDRNSEGGGIIIYGKEGIPCKILKSYNTIGDFEGIFFEINLRKNKRLFFGGYNPKKENIVNFLTNVASTLDHFLTNYDNLFLMGDFNSESTEKELVDFCETYNLCNIMKKPTCYKNPINPRSVDLFLTNRNKNYHHSNTVETGLSDHHKMVVTVMKSFFKKAAPHIIKYRD